MQPIHLAISVLTISILASFSLLKTTIASWLPFVLILTFSSGMMTLFIYTTSFSPNEKTNINNSYLILALPLGVVVLTPFSNTNIANQSINVFTSITIFFTMAGILIITIISISNHGHHPNQTISSSF